MNEAPIASQFLTPTELVALSRFNPFLPNRLGSAEDKLLAFWSKVNLDGPNGCWLWTLSQNSTGYNSAYVNRRLVSTHRLAFRLLRYEIPLGLVLDHLCLNPGCCNPYHLEPVTHTENVRRAAVLITHCPRGHEYTERNTRVDKAGSRVCRQCDRDRMRLKREVSRE